MWACVRLLSVMLLSRIIASLHIFISTLQES